MTTPCQAWPAKVTLLVGVCVLALHVLPAAARFDPAAWPDDEPLPTREAIVETLPKETLNNGSILA